jgi:hypothetical protein
MPLIDSDSLKAMAARQKLAHRRSEPAELVNAEG